MPENDRLTKLIERRKKQEKENDRIRIHKNHLDNMRLEKLTNFLEWGKHLTKQEHLNTEAKCLKKLEKLYERQCKIEDERKLAEYEKKKQQERQEVKLRILEKDNDEEIPDRERRRVVSANKQEQERAFTNKAKSLSSGYRDNDPPLSYYRRHGLIPPDRIVSPQVSAVTQAQTGGGFVMPASALHIKKLILPGAPKRPEFTTSLDNRVPSEPDVIPNHYDVDRRNRNDDDYALERVIEENESEFEKMSTKSSSTTSEDEPVAEIIKVDVVNIRPSTAPGVRNLKEPPTSGLVTSTEDNTEETKIVSVLRHNTTKRPSTAGVTFNAEQERDKPAKPRLRRQSSAISFAELPPSNRRRSSMKAPPLTLLHRRQSNVAEIHKNIQKSSNLLKPKQNKLRRPSGSRMGLLQSVMTNAENEVLLRKMEKKSKCIEAERYRRWHEQRSKSAPPGSVRNYSKEEEDEEYRNYMSVRLIGAELLNASLSGGKNSGQKALLGASVDYMKRIQEKVEVFVKPNST